MMLFEMSQPLESMLMASPESPMVRVPVVVRVPLILFEPMVPPERVSASVMYASPTVVEAETTPLLLVVRTPPVVPSVSAARYAFPAVRPVVEAYDDEAVVKRAFVAKRLVDEAFVVVPLVAV